jgi:hypothetical protein
MVISEAMPLREAAKARGAIRNSCAVHPEKVPKIGEVENVEMH